MLGNLVASLIAAESIVTTEAKAKALRPVAEKCVTAARKGGVAQHRNVVALIRDKDMTHKLFEEIGPRYVGPARRVHPHPEAGPTARVTTRRWRGSSSSRGGEAAGAAPQRWRLLIAYDGAAFRGFALQPEVPTVAGALRLALGRTARMSEPPVMTCAGRTDAGVHARGQVVHVDLPAVPFDGPGLARALNRQLAPEVVVRRAEEVGHDFDARRSATGRTYRYLVWNAPEPDPLLAAVAWHVRDPLDLVSMRTASDVLLGSHDFRSFCRRPPGTDAAQPIVRRVTRARWSVDDGPEATDAQAHGRGGTVAALRDRRRVVLPPDGAIPRVESGRGRPGAGQRGHAQRTSARGYAPQSRRPGTGAGVVPGRRGLWRGVSGPVPSGLLRIRMLRSRSAEPLGLDLATPGSGLGGPTRALSRRWTRHGEIHSSPPPRQLPFT